MKVKELIAILSKENPEDIAHILVDDVGRDRETIELRIYGGRLVFKKADEDEVA